MNLPKLFEGAMAETILVHAKLTTLPRLRTWQALDADARWSPENDRVFPLIDIRCTPLRVDPDNGVTISCTLSILIATVAEDDKNHQSLAGYYEAVQTILDALYAQFRAGAAGAERKTFDKHISDNRSDTDPEIQIGGFEHGEVLEPFEDGGANFIGMVFIIHFSRNDY